MGNQNTYTRFSSAALSRERESGPSGECHICTIVRTHQNHKSGLQWLRKFGHLWDTLVDIHGLRMNEIYAKKFEQAYFIKFAVFGFVHQQATEKVIRWIYTP